MMSKAAAQPGPEKCVLVELQHSSSDACFDGDAGAIGRVAASAPTGASLDLKGARCAGCQKAASVEKVEATHAQFERLSCAFTWQSVHPIVPGRGVCRHMGMTILF